MNTFGKVLVVFIFVASLVFMSSAVAVWSINRNWREEITKPGGWKDRVTQAEQRMQQLQTQHEALVQELEAERAAKRMALARLESERQLLAQQLTQLNSERAQLAQQASEAASAMRTLQQNIAEWQEEVDQLRGQVRTAQQDREQQFRRVVGLTDQIHQAQGELERLEQRSEQLRTLANRYATALQNAGFDPNSALVDTPPKVDGQVRVVRNGRVEVNIGSDDGLRRGDTLEVFRGSNYLGRLRVTDVAPDQAVAEILRDLQRGRIQRGDNVTTQLKIS